jgi:predicted small metal-binding protein
MYTTILSFREIVNIIKYNFLIKETMKRLACRDVGLDCEFVMDGSTEEDILNKANDHAWKVHAIKPEEMTSEMKVKIRDSIKEY